MGTTEAVAASDIGKKILLCANCYIFFAAFELGEGKMENPPLVDSYINEASKLNGEHYVNWKFKLMIVLESYNAWSIVAGDEPRPAVPALIPEWNKIERKAKVTL